MPIISLYDRIYSMRICLVPIMLFTMRVKNSFAEGEIFSANIKIMRTEISRINENYLMIACVDVD